LANKAKSVAEANLTAEQIKTADALRDKSDLETKIKSMSDVLKNQVGFDPDDPD
jgi:hypothetical protein